MTREELQALIAAAESGEDAPQSDHLDARWDALASDALSESDRAALEAMAAEGPAYEAALEAMTPLGEGFLDRVEGALPSVRVEEPPPSLLARVLAALMRPAVLVPLGALAAALLVVAFLPEEPGMPAYSFALEGGDQALRSGDAPTWTYSEGALITVILKPERAVEGAPAVIVSLDDWSRRIAVEPEVAPSGVIRLSGTVGEMPWILPPGEHTLLVAVGPASEPFAPDAAGWKAFSGALEVVP